MFYYAEINNDYLVINLYGLTESSTNPKYIAITEEQYMNDDLVGKYYNSLTNVFEVMDMDECMGSTDNVQVDATNMILSTKLDNMQAEINNLANNNSDSVSQEDLQVLEDIVDTKANAVHTHTEYALVDHAHDNYATQVALDTLGVEVDEKADISHTHSEYAPLTHSHSDYAPLSHSHDDLASEDYVDEKVGAITVESIGALPNTTVIPTVPTNVSAFVNDAGYLTEHQSLNGLATETYVNTQIDAIDIPNTLSDLTTDSTHRVVTDTEKATWNAKSDFSGSYNDLTDKPTIPSISGLATETYVDEAVSTKADSNHNHNSIYYTETEIDNLLSGKANTSHSHNDIYYTETEINDKLATKADSSHNHTGVYDVSGAAASALSDANAYTDEAIDVLSEAVAAKANSSTFNSHTGNTTVHITSEERANWNSAKTHANSAHAPVNAEENQNAFSNVAVGSTTISADSKSDTLTLVAGNNVTITPNATNDSITISSANTVYTHPTTAGNKHIPAGGASGQILRWGSDGTAVWGNDNNTTYGVATQTSNGLMSETDKVKLDGIANNANNYVLPSAGTSLGGVKSGGDVTISSGVITVNDDSHNHIISNVDGLQSALDSKAESGHNHDGVYYTETEIDTLLEGKANSSHTHTISNITNLQTTLDGKANASHGTHVSYSTTAPVMDGSASVGTASTVARSDHKHPTDTSRAAQTSLDSHTSNKSNPHGVTLAQLGLTATAAELNILDGVTATTDELNCVDGVTSNIQTQLNAKASSSHTHSAATTSAAGLMSASDKAKLDGIASGANAYTLPTASSTLGGVKTTSTVTSNSGYTACPIIGGVPYYKDTNTTYSLGSFGVTATAAELNALDGITATVTELNYVDGVTSNIQTQLNGKAASSHTHNYAGSSSAGGAATSANKLNTNAGDANTPVYFNNGVPVACTSLDLNTSGNAATATNVAWSGVTSKPSYYDAKAIKSITRSGTTFTYTCMDGTTGTFTQQDNNTTYSVATTSANGLMSSSDKSKLDGMVLATVSEVETYLGI